MSRGKDIILLADLDTIRGGLHRHKEAVGGCEKTNNMLSVN